MIKIKGQLKTGLILCMILGIISGVFADNIIEDVPASANENRTIQRETTIYNGSCDISQDLAFYQNSPIYLRVGQPKSQVSYVFDKTETYVRAYNQALFVGNLKFPYVSNFVPSTTIDQTDGNILTVDATGASFSGLSTIIRNQIAGQFVTINNERSIVQNNNGSTLNYYYIRANDLSIQNGTMKVIINPNLTPKKSCTNYYVARCGDNVTDKATGNSDGNGGLITQAGTFLPWHTLSIKPNEACDDGTQNGQPGKCKTDCSGIQGGNDPVCGNGIIETGEFCDSNNEDGEACIPGTPGCCNTTCTAYVPVDSGELSVNKTIVGGATNFALGDNVQFRIDFDNQSNQTINNVKIEDILPAGLSYVNSEIHGATNPVYFYTGWSGSNFLVNYTGFSLTAGQSGYVLINTTMNACTSSTNFASWSGGIWSGYSNAIANCESTAVLHFIKRVSNTTQIIPGDTVGFTIEVTNNIGKTMNNVIIQDIWPTNNGCITMIPGTDYTWNLGTLNIGSARLLSFSGLVQNSISCAGNYVNTGRITYTVDGQNKTDNTAVNFNVAAVTQDIDIKKTVVGNGPRGPGSEIIFEIEYMNRGQSNIAGFTITDVLSPIFEYVDSSVEEGPRPLLYPTTTRHDNPLTWTFPNEVLEPGEGGKIRLIVKIK